MPSLKVGKGEQGTCPSSPLGKRRAGSSLSNARWGQELDRGRVSWQAQRVWRKTGSSGWRKGTGSWKRKISLPGRRDKAKLLSKSLEASLLGEDLKTDWEWEKIPGIRPCDPGGPGLSRPAHYLAKGWWRTCWAKGIGWESWSGVREEDVRPWGLVWDAARATREFTRDSDVEVGMTRGWEREAEQKGGDLGRGMKTTWKTIMFLLAASIWNTLRTHLLPSLQNSRTKAASAKG